MKSVSVLIGFIAACAVGEPVEASNSNTSAIDLPEVFTQFRCRNSDNPNGIIFDKDTVFANAQAFPDRETSGLSGYPHEFANFQGFVWDFNTWRCGNYKPLLEMPVFPDGHLYPWNVNRNAAGGEQPGPARAIYAAAGGIEFCGLIAHTTGNQGYFAKCEEI
ncbi:Ribonuclease/ribotoxin [Achaetomium macrosporum]|uniref:Ribonuclease/ribotoxin n=1 Tax=Achaetomium macrosporum TaxID=79813 RepID=A0AAN7H7S2_9PEZI|nr:Ribonuclease/ribotoxin [Achaetomium macrosporum]